LAIKTKIVILLNAESKNQYYCDFSADYFRQVIDTELFITFAQNGYKSERFLVIFGKIKHQNEDYLL